MKRHLHFWFTTIIVGLLTMNIACTHFKPEGWTTYSIPDVCSFAIPATMEVRSDESVHGKFVKAVHNSSFFEMLCDECDLFYDEAKLVLQPKGLNSDPFSKSYHDASNSYARILFNFAYSELNQEDVHNITPSDLRELDQQWRQRTKNEIDCIAPYFESTGQFKWYTTRKKNLAGMTALTFGYDRPGHDGETHVNVYHFYFDQKQITINTSYKIKEESKYKNDFEIFMSCLEIETKPQKRNRRKKQVYTSDKYHVSYTYDQTKYNITPKLNSSSHCFCKLSSIDGYNSILLSAWDGIPDGLSIHTNESIDEMRTKDQALSSSTTYLITNCEKVYVDGEEALKSVFVNDVYGIKYVHTTYRVYYKQRLYTIDFHILKTLYDKDEKIADELVKGLKFN